MGKKQKHCCKAKILIDKAVGNPKEPRGANPKSLLWHYKGLATTLLKAAVNKHQTHFFLLTEWS